MTDERERDNAVVIMLMGCSNGQPTNLLQDSMIVICLRQKSTLLVH
jgi:hypothetical protein